VRVVLFDLDGTLVSCGGAGRRALERALADRCGPLDGRLAPLRLDGMTDRLIVREALGILAHPFSEETRDEILARYLLHLALEVDGPGYAVLPGAVEALERLRAAGVAYGLCTGNLVEGARLKLARGGLDRHFEWNAGAIGGFGADGEARERLVIAAVRRAAVRLGEALAPSEVLVVGDTPRDIAAAHAAGCPALGVATGRFTAAELAACGADHVAGSLAEPAAVRLLGGP
jgi:phosphoglycolate phosphatase-like HAD superfamily hydrolase